MKIVLGNESRDFHRPVAKDGSWLYFFISGRVTEAMVAAVALVDHRWRKRPRRRRRGGGQSAGRWPMVGGPEEPRADAGIALSHEDEQGNDRQVGENGEKICREIQGGFPKRACRNRRSLPGYHEADGHFQKHQDDQDHKSIIPASVGLTEHLLADLATSKAERDRGSRSRSQCRRQTDRPESQGKGYFTALFQVHGVDLGLPGDDTGDNRDRNESSMAD